MVQFCSTRLGFKDIYTLEKDNFADLAQVLVLELISPEMWPLYSRYFSVFTV